MKWNCEQFQAMLDGFEVPGPTWMNRLRMAAHRRRCADCAALWEKDQEVQKLLKSLPVVACPDTVTQRVLAVTGADVASKTKRRQVPWGHRWRLGLAGAAVTLTALAILFIIEGTEPPASNPDTGQYTAEDIQRARAQAQWSLAMAGRKLHTAEKQAVEDILLNELPQSMRRSLKNSLSMIKGG